MELVLSLLLALSIDGRAPAVRTAVARASARAHGVDVLRHRRVLMFGDSMVNCGINVWLKPRLAKLGVERYATHSWASSTTQTWSTSPKIKLYLQRYDPDVVIIVIGSNELFHPYPRMMIKPIQAILAQIGPRRQVYWVGPPAWKKDKGIIAVMESQLPPGHFLDSAKVAMTRQSDGYHPDFKGSRQWADAIWAWLTQLLEKRYPRP
jgi:hypothetical protein